MDWNIDVATGDWMKARIDTDWRGTMHDVVPRGFEAYARVFHPATRSRPVGRDWPAGSYDTNRREWEAFAADQVEIETVPATWADAAAAFGTRMHPLAQWGAIVRARSDEWNPSDWQQVTSPDGWQFDSPSEGQLDPASVSALVRELQGGATDTIGFVGIWEGYGGLLGHMGIAPSRAFLSFGEQEPQDAEAQRHRDVVERMQSDPFNNPYRKETWQPGILPDAVSAHPRLELPGRDYVLFGGDLGVFTDDAWQLHVPWRDREAEAHGFAPSAQNPNLLWPADRTWCTVSEIDWDSTIVCGPRAVIDRVLRSDALESAEIPADASLQWDADRVNA